MVQPAKSWQRNHCRVCLRLAVDLSTLRRVLSQRVVHPVLPRARIFFASTGGLPRLLSHEYFYQTGFRREPSFLRLPSNAVGNGCRSVVTADFNGDGNTDIADAYWDCRHSHISNI
jgi:hypothetical protein